MKYQLFLLFCLFTKCNNAFCQNYFLSTKTNTRINMFEDIESIHGSVKLSNTVSYEIMDISRKLGQPVRYLRYNRYNYPLTIEYYFSIPDSIVRYITISMETMDSTSKLEGYEISGAFKVHDSIYNDIKNELILVLGEPAISNKIHREFIFNSEFWQQDDTWTLNMHKSFMYRNYYFEKEGIVDRLRVEFHLN